VKGLQFVELVTAGGWFLFPPFHPPAPLMKAWKRSPQHASFSQQSVVDGFQVPSFSIRHIFLHFEKQ
jgi:hypothetical protein